MFPWYTPVDYSDLIETTILEDYFVLKGETLIEMYLLTVFSQDIIDVLNI